MNTKSLIFKTTLDLSKNHGIEGITVALITKHSGVSNGSIFHFFKTLKDLHTQLFISVMEDYTQFLSNETISEGPYFDRLYSQWDARISWNIQHTTKMNYSKQFQQSTFMDKKLYQSSRLILEEYRNLLQEGMDLKKLKGDDVNYLLFMMGGSVKSISDYLTAQPDRFDEEFLHSAFTDFCLSIIAPRFNK